MGKKRGLSYEEKRERMLSIFTEGKTVYNAKEVLKYSVKKGISFGSIKDIMQSLIDDDLITKEKIGSGAFLWCFPSEKYAAAQKKLKETLFEIKEVENEIEGVDKEIKEAEKGKEETEEREEILKMVAELENKKKLNEEEIKGYERSDPKLLDGLNNSIKFLKNQTEKLTDNLFEIESFVRKRKPELKPGEFFKHFGLSEEFDYFEVTDKMIKEAFEKDKKFAKKVNLKFKKIKKS